MEPLFFWFVVDVLASDLKTVTRRVGIEVYPTLELCQGALDGYINFTPPEEEPIPVDEDAMRRLKNRVRAVSSPNNVKILCIPGDS